MSRPREAPYYFAYGSNMNPTRVRRRKMQFDSYSGGWLEGYRLVFNKRSTILPGAASANVDLEPDSKVEGVLYRLTRPEEIEVMDVFEGYPRGYNRELLPIVCGSRVISAWVYIANQEFVAEGLKPARWYLEHLLSGAPYLSHDYYQALKQTETLPDSSIEPT